MARVLVLVLMSSSRISGTASKAVCTSVKAPRVSGPPCDVFARFCEGLVKSRPSSEPNLDLHSKEQVTRAAGKTSNGKTILGRTEPSFALFQPPNLFLQLPQIKAGKLRERPFRLGAFIGRLVGAAPFSQFAQDFDRP